MFRNNEEEYQTLGWIINKSEQGLFLAVADEEIQMEIVGIYRMGAVGIYDYRRHPGAYSFWVLNEWMAAFPRIPTFFLVNFQLAIQQDEDVKRLNTSRDMIAGLGKNVIFVTTPRGDDMLAAGAYDFYSFLRLRMIFHNDRPETEAQGKGQDPDDGMLVQDSSWEPDEARKKSEETYALLDQAKDEKKKARYGESERLLLKAMAIREKLLGTGHLEMAEIYRELGNVYWECKKYAGAEEYLKKALLIREKVLGEDHPETAVCYHNLALVYDVQGRYHEAEELYRKCLDISEKMLGKEHPDTADTYHDLADLCRNQGKYDEAEAYYKKAWEIRERVLGKDHPDTQESYCAL